MTTVTTQCQLTERNFTLIPDIEEFQNTLAIRRAHGSTPRFGHTSDISVLMNDNATDDDKRDYIIGIMSAAIVLVTFVFISLLILLLFKCLGSRRVGILSGKPSTKKKVKMNDRDGTLDRIETVPDCTLICARIIVLICSVGITIAIIYMIIWGVHSLRDAADDTQRGIQKAQMLTNEATILTQNFITVQTNAVNDTQKFLNYINDGFCPTLRTQLCTDIETGIECNFNGIPYGDKIELLTGQTGQIALQEAMNVENDLKEWSITLQEAYEKADDFNWAFAVASTFGIIFVILTWMISYGVLAVWFNCNNNNCVQKSLQCVRHWLIIPLFIFFLLLSTIFSAVFIMGSTISSDFCYQSPDTYIELLLNKYYHNIDVTVASFLQYYINSCPIDEFPTIFEYHVQDILEVTDSVSNFASSILTDTVVTVDGIVQGPLEDVCGSNTTHIVDLAYNVENTLCQVSNLLYDIYYFFRCDNWLPLYRTVIYDAICYNGNDGFFYIATTQFVVVVMALIILSMRAAFFQTTTETMNNNNILQQQEQNDYNNNTPMSVSSSTSSSNGINNNRRSFK